MINKKRRRRIFSAMSFPFLFVWFLFFMSPPTTFGLSLPRIRIPSATSCRCYNPLLSFPFQLHSPSLLPSFPFRPSLPFYSSICLLLPVAAVHLQPKYRDLPRMKVAARKEADQATSLVYSFIPSFSFLSRTNIVRNLRPHRRPRHHLLHHLHQQEQLGQQQQQHLPSPLVFGWSWCRRKERNGGTAVMATGSGAEKQQIRQIRRVASRVHKETEESIEEDEKEEARRKRLALLKEWRVLLLNDDVHTFAFVTEAIVRVIPRISKARAHAITVEAHRNGQASIISTWKKRAEAFCDGLQKAGLSISMAPDKTLEDNKAKDKRNGD
eukprot:GHVT01000537.1.p1 GENE.GHVT01000537.1~~GHVT01000537.1.p1  ORF type:complete len:325 (+),score=55.00 GHVT01000537.1:95-1069(+)